MNLVSKSLEFGEFPLKCLNMTNFDSNSDCVNVCVCICRSGVESESKRKLIQRYLRRIPREKKNKEKR